MIRRNISIVFLVIVFLLNSCESWLPCLEGDGDIVTENRIGGTFTSIQIEGEFDVRIDSAQTTSVEITTDGNLMDKIETVVKGGKLVIQENNDGCINYSSQTQVLIKCPNLSSITQMGSGNIEVYNFRADNFIVSQAGSGDITMKSLSITNNLEVSLIGSGNVWLSGRANDASYILSGSGNIDAEAMRVFNCTTTLAGSGNIHAFVYNLLKVTLTGSGSVYYYGKTEEVVKHISGSGDVINRSY